MRFDCRSGLYCSTRRFHQQLRRLEADPPHDHEWARTGLAEVTEPLAPVSITTTTTVAPGTPVAPLDLQITGYTELDDGGYQVCFDWDLPDSGPPGSLHLIQWKSGTEEYQDSGPTTFLWFDVAVCLETFGNVHVPSEVTERGRTRLALQRSDGDPQPIAWHTGPGSYSVPTAASVPSRMRVTFRCSHPWQPSFRGSSK